MKYLVNRAAGEISVLDTNKSLLIISKIIQHHSGEGGAWRNCNLIKSNEGHFWLVHSKWIEPKALTPSQALKLYFDKLKGIIDVRKTEKLFGIKIKGDI